jgi:hypothetical protein
MTMGFLINKFRGDPRLFESGVKIIEERNRTAGPGGGPLLSGYSYRFRRFGGGSDGQTGQSRSVGKYAQHRHPSAAGHQQLHRPGTPGPGAGGRGQLPFPAKRTCRRITMLDPARNQERHGRRPVGSKSAGKKRCGLLPNRGGTILGICGGYQILGARIQKTRKGWNQARRKWPGFNSSLWKPGLKDKRLSEK